MTTSRTKPRSFRKDINGLRAIAVIAVVIFHFYPTLLPGGFAGVDVFFVISGFLMSGIIFKGIEGNSFSLLRFYVARANRLIPALAVFCLILLILGWFFMTTWDYKTLGRDVATTMLFVSNIMYSMRSNYFDSGNNFLLHTWTLSVEWQFYIFYPIILVLLKKFISIENLKRTVVILCIVSFLFSIYSSIKWPAESYFLLPSRAWEMLFGGIAYLYPFRNNSNKNYLDSTVLELLGILLIISSYFFISSENSWPGYLAAIPVVGTWLVIQSSKESSFITGSAVFQKLGLWSYSIYLWHWPIAVSFNYYDINVTYKPIGILLSVLLGFISFYTIEKRRPRSVNLKKPIAAYVFITLSFAVVGSLLFKTQGIASREVLESNSLIQGGVANDHTIHEGLLLLNTKDDYDYLLIGDSNSNHYTRGILKEGSRVKSSWYATCISFPNSISTRSGHYVSWKNDCKENYKVGLGDKNIIIAQSWARPEKGSLECTTNECKLTGSYDYDMQYQLRELIEFYGKEKHIYIIGELPKPINNKIMKCLQTNKLLGLNRLCNSNEGFRGSSKRMNNILSIVASDYSNVFFIDPGNAICDDGVCNYNDNGNSIFMPDGEHLSGYGSEVIWDHIIKSIKSI